AHASGVEGDRAGEGAVVFQLDGAAEGASAEAGLCPQTEGSRTSVGEGAQPGKRDTCPCTRRGKEGRAGVDPREAILREERLEAVVRRLSLRGRVPEKDDRVGGKDAARSILGARAVVLVSHEARKARVEVGKEACNDGGVTEAIQARRRGARRNPPVGN